MAQQAEVVPAVAPVGRRRRHRREKRLRRQPRLSASPAPCGCTTRCQRKAETLLWHGAGELLWRHDGERYDAKLEVSAPLLPTRVQQSTGSITADGLAPLRFSDRSRGEQAAHFQRDEGKVSFSSNRPDAPLLPGAQDRLSVLLQLGALIAGNPGKFRPDATDRHPDREHPRGRTVGLHSGGRGTAPASRRKCGNAQAHSQPAQGVRHQGRALAGSRDGLRPRAPASDTAERRLAGPAVVVHRQGLSPVLPSLELWRVPALPNLEPWEVPALTRSSLKPVQTLLC